MKKYFIVILKSFCALIAVFFLLLALIGSKEWILHMFIEKNGKAWLDWYFYLPMMFFSISFTFYLSFITFSILIKHKVLQKGINIMCIMAVLSLFSYSIFSLNNYSSIILFIINFLLPIFIGLFILAFNIFWNKKIFTF